MNKTVIAVTERIIERSRATREMYLQQMNDAKTNTVARKVLSCGNLAHGFAGCAPSDKKGLSGDEAVNIGIISAYNDMLSAHKTYEHYPEKLREYAREMNAVLQVAGGVPAMCDGVTQGQPGMELSLLSRDTIALSAAIGLTHNMFDSVMCLGICDKIVPGLLMGALRFGHLPVIFLPGGPMPSGITNEEKARIRQEFAKGNITREELLKGESDSYHSPGTCTFYGTANSNQMLMEVMGLQLPGSSFVNPDTELRHALNKEAVKVSIENAKAKRSLFEIIDERTMVNAIVGLLATGGSTNHTIHIPAMARAAGIIVNWDDMSDLSDVVPSITRVYPNGAADVNHFHASGGMGYVIHTLLENGYLHENVNTIIGHGLSKFTQEPKVKDGAVEWVQGPTETLNDKIVRSANNPFSAQGGMKVMKGNLGRAVMKVSAVAEEHYVIKAPAIVFDEQEDLIQAFKRDELNKDFVAVLPFQGPRANGMPELHRLTPTLTVLLKKGHKVALLTDGRMSGASGKVPAAIHLAPEALEGGILAKVRTGDEIIIDVNENKVELVDHDTVNAREARILERPQTGFGRELYGRLRTDITTSECGASFIL